MAPGHMHGVLVFTCTVHLVYERVSWTQLGCCRAGLRSYYIPGCNGLDWIVHVSRPVGHLANFTTCDRCNMRVRMQHGMQARIMPDRNTHLR